MADLTPCFFYGTLRVGAYNARYDAKRIDRNCIAQGRIYFVQDSHGYPVAKFDEEGEIVGDVVWLDPEGDDYFSICQMEKNAGYEIRNILVQKGPVVTRVQAWHYIGKPRGKLIESGDWLKAVESRC